MIRGLLVTSFYAALFSSAFVVYSYGAHELDVMVAFAWFSLFAFLALTWRIEHFRALVAELKNFATRIAQKDLLSLGVLLHAVCFAIYFALLLFALGHTNAVYVLVMLLLQPIGLSLIGIWYFGDVVRSTFFYFTGLLLTLGGLALFRLENWRYADTTVTDWDIVMVAVVGLVVFQTVLRTQATRSNLVSVRFAFQLSFAFSVVFGLALALFRGKAGELVAVPFQEEIIALAYLGIVPTAIANKGIQECNNRYGIPLVQSAEALKPVWGWLLSAGISATLGAIHPQMSALQYLGAALAMVGVGISLGLGRPERVDK